MHYVNVALADIERDFQLARARPRHLAPQPKSSSPRIRKVLSGLIDTLQASQHRLEMFRRFLPNGDKRSCLDRLANILAEIRGLTTT